jgi:hypothetical protein
VLVLLSRQDVKEMTEQCGFEPRSVRTFFGGAEPDAKKTAPVPSEPGPFAIIGFYLWA